MSLVGKALTAGKGEKKSKAKEKAKKAKEAAQGVKKAAKVVMMKVKIFAAAVCSGFVLIVVLVCALFILIEKVKADINEWFESFFPETVEAAAANSYASGTIVEAAKYVHKILEEEGYTYGSNPAATVEESAQTTCDCSTYVDWVLAVVGLKLPSRYCPNIDFSGESWIELVTTDANEAPNLAQAGDIVLFYGHIQIYGGIDADGSPTWYNAGSDEAISTAAPSSWATPFSGGGEAGELVGVYRVNLAE